MSHRVTVKTEIKDRSIAISALKDAKMSFREASNGVIEISSGDLRGAKIDLSTGEITGDTDFSHTAASLGRFRQNYAEAKFRQEAIVNGISIESREVDTKGVIRMRCRTALGRGLFRSLGDR